MTRCSCAVSLLLSVAGFTCATSWNDAFNPQRRNEELPLKKCRKIPRTGNGYRAKADRTQGVKVKLILTFVVGITTVALSPKTWAASWSDDSHYVSLGPRNGYYIVRPDSRLFRQLGLYEAPVIDTADPLYHGYGADALAFRFNQNGVLIAPPAYMAQELPYDFTLGESDHWLVVAQASMMWKLFLGVRIPLQRVQTVLSGITRWKFIIRLKSTAAITIDLASLRLLLLRFLIRIN